MKLKSNKEISVSIITFLNEKYNLKLRAGDEIKAILDTELERRYRMEGNSTRQIDDAIQILFDGGVVVARDHWEGGTHQKANQDLFDRILRRLQFEHNLEIRIKNNGIRIDKNKLEIELLSS